MVEQLPWWELRTQVQLGRTETQSMQALLDGTAELVKRDRDLALAEEKTLTVAKKGREERKKVVSEQLKVLETAQPLLPQTLRARGCVRLFREQLEPLLCVSRTNTQEEDLHRSEERTSAAFGHLIRSIDSEVAKRSFDQRSHSVMSELQARLDELEALVKGDDDDDKNDDDDGKGLNTEVVQEQEQEQEKVVEELSMDFGPFDDCIVDVTTHWQPEVVFSTMVDDDPDPTDGPYRLNRMMVKPSHEHISDFTTSDAIHVSPNFAQPEYLGALKRRLRNITVFIRTVPTQRRESEEEGIGDRYCLVTLAEAEALLRTFEGQPGHAKYRVELHSLTGVKLLGCEPRAEMLSANVPTHLETPSADAPMQLGLSTEEEWRHPIIGGQHLQRLEELLKGDRVRGAKSPAWTFESVLVRLLPPSRASYPISHAGTPRPRLLPP